MSRYLLYSTAIFSVACSEVDAPAPSLATAPAEARPVQAPPRQRFAITQMEALDSLDANPLMKQIHVSLSSAATVRLACTSPDDDLEDFELASTILTVDQRLAVQGLLPDTRYICVADATDDSGHTDEGQISFLTGSLPDSVPSVALDEDDGQTQAYFLYNHRSPIGYTLIDRDGRVRWYEEPTGAEGDADLGVELAWQPDLQELLTCGGNAVTPHLTTLTGVETWTAPAPDADWLSYHHDCVRLASDEVIALESNDVTYDGVGLYGTAIKDYAADGTLLWQWSAQQGIDQGVLTAESYGPGVDMDPWHANALGWLDDGEGPAAYLSDFGTRDVIRIDRTTGEISWVLGEGGDFSLVDLHGHRLDDGAWFDGQHGLDWRMQTDGLHALIYDNGIASHESRVMELRIDPVSRIATQLWVFTEPHWATPIWGDADWLPDGDVLVAKGHCSTCDVVDESERSEILVLDPVAHVVTWRARFKSAGDAIYRAQQIDGCDIFANARFCPELSAVDGAGELHPIAADQR